MWNAPTAQELSRIPGLYETDHILIPDTIIHMHFFIAGCHWYVAEFDSEDQFFGYAVLHGDLGNAEWVYFSLAQLQSINIHGLEVDRDLHWQPVPFGDIPGIGVRYED